MLRASLLALLLASGAAAQPADSLLAPPAERPAARGLSASLGAGPTTDWMGQTASITYRSGDLVWTLRSAASIENDGNAIFAGLLGAGDAFAVSDVALMLGRVLHEDGSWTVSASSGLSVVNTIRFTDQISTGVGLPLSVSAAARLNRYIALGATGFGSVNTIESFGGVGVALTVGRFR